MMGLYRGGQMIPRFLLILTFFACASATPAQHAPIKVILDTDIGTDIDDAWALGLAMTSPEFELIAVTITDGNTSARARVACKLLHKADPGTRILRDA
jgi:hypothetical protein